MWWWQTSRPEKNWNVRLVTYYAARGRGLPSPRAAAANRESWSLTYYERQTDLQCGSDISGGWLWHISLKLQLCALLKAKVYWILLDVPGPALFTPITVAEILSLVSTQILETRTINSSPTTEWQYQPLITCWKCYVLQSRRQKLLLESQYLQRKGWPSPLGKDIYIM